MFKERYGPSFRSDTDSRSSVWDALTVSFLPKPKIATKLEERFIDIGVNYGPIAAGTVEKPTFQLIGNTLPKYDYHLLLKKINELDRDFTFYVEARAGRLKSDDYSVLKEAGFTFIQTGIETFSQNFLKKMKKGVRVIENIAALKFCKENGINNGYNIIVNYPNEENIDFEATISLDCLSI